MIIRSPLAALLAAVFLIALCPRDTAFAEDAVPSQASAELAGQAEDFRAQSLPEAPAEPQEEPAIDQSQEPRPAEEGDAAGPSFVLTDLRFEGNTVFPSSAFAPYAAPYLGQNIRLSELKLVAKAVTDHYRTRGYVNSRAIVGPQKIENGIVTIRIIEARLGRTIVEGNRYYATPLIEEALDLPRDRIFRYNDLESRLRFVNRNPDLRAAAYLEPGTEPETSDLRLKVNDRLPVHAYYEFNNRGTKFTHRSRHLMTGVHNNFLGRADTLSVSAAMAEQGAFDAVSGGWSVPLWRTGTTFQVSGSYVDSLLVKHLKSAEIEGLAWTVTPAVVQELISTPAHQLSFYTALEIKDSKTTINDQKTSLDRMRVLVAGPRWAFFDKGGRTGLSADIHWGIPGLLGGSESDDLNASRTGSGGDFVHFTGAATRLQKLPGSLVGVLRGNGQWSGASLTSMEQMRLGGYSSVRGYPESDSAGDYGFAGTAEVQVPAPIPDAVRIPVKGGRLNQALRLVGFVDAGKVFDHEREALSNQKDRTLIGAGAGVRLSLAKDLSAQFDYAWPLGDDSTDKVDQPQAHFSVRAGF